ncbi:MAG: DUF599 family protein [Mesorhizobium sp.]|nr:DUF599 family protein [Mesorhizobium sp.]MBL8578626.1 DUF599 family protein [Mesorhizobium sp.]
MLLSTADLAALLFFLAMWTLHALAVAGKLGTRVSLSTAMNRQREMWMRTMARRDLRMIDTSIMLGLQQGTAFFGSSALIAIGGCFALIGSSDRVMNVLGDLPLSAAASRPVFEIKVIGLLLIFAYSFFKFGWSYRLFNYCSILIGAVPVQKDEPAYLEETEIAVQRAARMNILAGTHFNAGLRGIFFSIGYLGWFVGPIVFALTTLCIFAVLVRRQFFSEAREAVISDRPLL